METQKEYGYLGPQGTFSEMCALKYSRACDKINPYDTIQEVVNKIKEQEIDRGIIPLENSQEGSVNISLDLLFNNSSLKIIGEAIIPIEHYLLAPEGVDMEDIEEIYSHPQAIAQSRDFLNQNLAKAKLNYTDSTASAAEIIQGSNNKAMIGSIRVNDIYDFKIIASNIEGELENYTRFIIITDQNEEIKFDKTLPDHKYKTSIVCTPEENRPGILYELLGEFANRNIDLTKIESRPTKKRLGEYLFYIDLEGNYFSSKGINQALKGVKDKSRLFRVLGCYLKDNINRRGESVHGGNTKIKK